jgi:hypothetical protein
VGVSKEYLSTNPLGKIPAFVGADGFVLSECIAIAIYSKLILFVFTPLFTLCYDEEHCQQFIPVLILRVE